MRSFNLPAQEVVYTPERDAVILRDYCGGVPLAEIHARVCALPGLVPANNKAIKTRAHILGAKRPEGWGNMARGVWTDERVALLSRMYPDPTFAWPTIIERMVNDFPALQPVTQKACEDRARKLGLRRDRVRPAERHRIAGVAFSRNVAVDQPMQRDLPPTLEGKLEKAAKMLAGKGRDFHVWSVVAHTGLEGWQVCMVAGRLAMGLPIR